MSKEMEYFMGAEVQKVFKEHVSKFPKDYNPSNVMATKPKVEEIYNELLSNYEEKDWDKFEDALLSYTKEKIFLETDDVNLIDFYKKVIANYPNTKTDKNMMQKLRMIANCMKQVNKAEMEELGLQDTLGKKKRLTILPKNT